MKNNLKFLSIALFAFAIGFSASNFAISDVTSNLKVAVVNVPKVVEASPQVKALTVENNKKNEEFIKFVNTANKAVENEKDAKKKAALKTKYEKEIKAKVDANTKSYQTKLAEIDKNISNIISTNAKAKGYNLVLTKSSVLMGGDDITNEIITKVQK